MLNKFKVSDVDIHLTEPADLWERYIEPAFLERAPRTIMAYGPRGRSLVAGHVIFKAEGTNRLSIEVDTCYAERQQKFYGRSVFDGWTPEFQIEGMDQAGVDLAFLYPTRGLSNIGTNDIGPDLALAMAKAYNNWIVEFAAYKPERMVPVAMAPRHNPEAAPAEIRRATELGCRGVFMRPEPIRGRNLEDPAFEPMWTALEELGLAVGLHSGTHSDLPTLGAHRFYTRLQSHTCSHPMEQMAAIVGLIGGGVLERHPRLRVAHLECGAGWLPYWLYRLDEQYEQLSFEVPELKMKPSEYFRRQCWISVESDEPLIREVADYVGEDRLVISSDFPHADHTPGGLKVFAERKDVPESVKRKTLWDNTMALYNR